jgi:cell division protein FtsQ
MRRRSRREAKRPTWTERQASLEGVCDAIRRQGQAARRRQRVRRAAPLAALAAFTAGAALAGLLAERAAAARPELFAVRTVALAGARRVDPGELARLAAEAGRSPAAVAEQLTRHPWIASARAARVAPATVVARVVEREPVAVLEPGGEGALLVDADGTPFAPAPHDVAGLPRLLLREPPAPGRPDPRLAAGIALAREAQAAGWPRLTLELDGPDPQAVPALRIAGLAPRVVLGPGDARAKLGRLARVLAEQPASRAAAEIDLRFAEQVVLRPAAAEPAPPQAAGRSARHDRRRTSSTEGRTG